MVEEERGSNLLPARGRHADREVRAALGSPPRAGVQVATAHQERELNTERREKSSTSEELFASAATDIERVTECCCISELNIGGTPRCCIASYPRASALRSMFPNVLIPISRGRMVSHFYGNGDVCDLTDKPRQVTVKLK